MNAFGGVFFLDGRTPREGDALTMVQRAVKWRPDQKGSWQGRSFAAAQLVRFNTPQSQQERALHKSAESGHVIFCDARLDNREELALKLGLSVWISLSDDELILRAYEKWDERCVQHLLGDFVFVIWDERSQTLFAARDPMGQRIFYFHHEQGRSFSFCTNVAGLLVLPHVPRSLNERKLADYLVYISPDPTQTFYQGIFRLQAGHTLKVSPNGLVFDRYWAMDLERQIRLKSDAEYLEQFNHIFAESVRCRLRSAYDVGAHLSGGLDSSSVCALAAPMLKEEGKTLFAHGSVPCSIPGAPSRKNWTYDDSALMEAVRDRVGNIELALLKDRHEISPLFELDTYFDHADTPILNPCSRAWTESIFRRARDANIRTMLTGAMGNATVSWRGESSPSFMSFPRHFLRSFYHSSRGWLREKFGLNPSWSWYSSIQQSYARAMDIPARHRKHFSHGLKGRKTQAWMLFSGPVLDAAAAYNTQRAIFGVEYRDPTHDQRLVEFCLALPEDQFSRAGQQRLLVRRAMRDKLPESVCWRQGRGEQGVGWFNQLSASKGELVKRVHAFADSPALARCLNLKMLSDMAQNWPRSSASSTKEYRYIFLRNCVSGLFVQHIEGSQFVNAEPDLSTPGKQQEWVAPLLTDILDINRESENGAGPGGDLALLADS